MLRRCGARRREQGVAVPAMDEQQAADLFVFFYAAGYFETPGDARRGKQLFLARRCGQCHGIDSPVRAGIRPVAEWDSIWDPIALAQQMWNHSSEMARALHRSKVPYPLLSAQELTDLLAWLRASRPPSHTAGTSAGVAGERPGATGIQGLRRMPPGESWRSKLTAPATASPISPRPCGTTPSAPEITRRRSTSRRCAAWLVTSSPRSFSTNAAILATASGSFKASDAPSAMTIHPAARLAGR